jgi:hypothetical protein
MYSLYDFVCYDLLHILLSCDKIMDPWNVYIYVCNSSVKTKLSMEHWWSDNERGKSKSVS